MKRGSRAGKFSGQRVLLVGLGLHGGGVATAQWLLRHGAEVRITDQKTRGELAASIKKLPTKGVSWTLGRPLPRDVDWADWLVQNPGVPNEHPLLIYAKRMLKPILNEASLFFQTVPAPTIGVTGTRGKTTTTLLIAHLLKAYHRQTISAGNLRDRPLLSIVDQLTPKHWAVLELSSFQLEGLGAVKRSPQIAVWTNLLVDHLNRYANMNAYAAAKSEVLRYQQPGDIAVLNADAAAVKRFGRVVRGQAIWYGLTQPAGRWSVFLRHGYVVEKKSGRLKKIFPINNVPLPGDHQRHNVLAAVGACLAAGVPASVIRRAIKTVPSVPHRQEIVRIWRGHRWINDTTATSPDGALAALAAFPKAQYILGGTDKRLNFSELVQALRQQPGPLIFLPGSATEKILRQLRNKKYRGETLVASSMSEAVRQAAARAHAGQDIVLTPGAASFGLFLHEFDRGEQFTKAVQALR